MQKNKEKKEYQYSHKTLNKFADLINQEYKGDYHKFLKDKQAILEDGTIIEYKNTENYYAEYTKGFDDADDFYRPKIVRAFWDRLYGQSLQIMIAKVEDEYSQSQSENGINIRLQKLSEIREKLKTLNILK